MLPYLTSCILNGSRFSHYFISILLSDNRNSQTYNAMMIMKTVLMRIELHQNTVCGTERQINVIINVAFILHVQKKYTDL